MRRFLPIYYRNALLYRRRHYSSPARLAYRALLACGMLLRLAGTAVSPTCPSPGRGGRRAYLAVLGVALGFGKSKLQNPKPKIDA